MNDLVLLAMPFAVALLFWVVWLFDVRRDEADHAGRAARGRRLRPIRTLMTPLAPGSWRERSANVALPAPRAQKLLPSYKKGS